MYARTRDKLPGIHINTAIRGLRFVSSSPKFGEVRRRNPDMTKFYGRLLLPYLIIVFTIGWVTSCIAAEVSFDGGNTLKATANSVWNHKATFKEDHNWWPYYMPDVDEETLQADPSSTIDRQRHPNPGRVDWPIGIPWEVDFDDLRLGVIAPDWRVDPADFARVQYPVPPPQSTETTADGHTITTTWIYDLKVNSCTADASEYTGEAPPIPSILPGVCGRQTQVYIPRHRVVKIVYDDNATPEDTNDDILTTTIWIVPPVIVPEFAPVSLRQVALDVTGSRPLEAMISSSTGTFCRVITRTVSGGQEEINVGLGSEPVWVEAAAVGAQATVIVIDPFSGEAAPESNPCLDTDRPEDTYPDINRIYFNYVRKGAGVLTINAPNGARLPDPYTVYAIPVLNSLDGSAKLKVNTGLFDGTLDPYRTKPNDADPRDPTKPGPYSPLLGVYDNPQCTGTNYWRPGNYSVNTGGYSYGVITIPPELQPEGGWKDWTTLYVKVSTFAVDAVWTRSDERSDPGYPKRINYFVKPDWMPGVITGNWPGAPTAYSVKPDVDPNKVRMRTVTGIYVPQLMNGTVIDSTHVVPRDPSRVKTVLAVFSLQSMNGTRVDETHVQPENPALISFVSAVYAIDTKPGTPIDSTHVVPTDSTVLQRMFRVRKVFIASNPSKDYYDHANPYTLGDTEINLVEPLPAGVSSVQIEFESPDLYDTENQEIAYKQGDPILTLNYPLPADSNTVRIVYGVGSGLDGFNHYDPTNNMTAFREGDPSIILKTPLPTGTTDVRILYGTDSDLQVRAAKVSNTSVAPNNIWTVARVRALYAIRDAMLGIRLDDNRVTPFDPTSIRTVLGVYPAKEMAAQIAEDALHVKPLDSQPNAFLAIRKVRGVYATDEQTGSAGEADPDGKIRRVVPSIPDIIGRVFRVYANGKDYYDPNNPETTYRTGDPYIKLSTPLDAGVTTLTINYETINLVTNPTASFAQGSNRITLDIPLPDSSPISIRVAYSANGSLYNPVAPVTRYVSGDPYIVLNTPLPAGTYEVDIVYADTRNRYCTDANPPDYAPGETEIPLMTGEVLPDDSTGAIVEYSAHLFPESYDPMEYDPRNPATADLRPFIPGDQTIRLNRLDPTVELPLLFRVPGAVKLCIAYQSDRQPYPHEMGSYTVNGRLDLPIPLPSTQSNIYITYRVLSNYQYTLNSEGKLVPTGGTWTVGRPYAGYVLYHNLLPPPPEHGYDFHPHLPPIAENGRFRGLCLAETPGTPVQPGARGVVRYRRREPDSPRGVLWISGIGGNYKGWIPMYWDTRASRDPASGAVYYVTASAGLNMANPKQQPSCNLEERQSPLANRLILDPNRNPMWYAPGLTANGDGSPKTIDAVGVVAWYFDEEAGNFVSVSNKQIPTIYDSRARGWALNWGEMINYGGQNGDRDWLESYPGLGNPDPLVTEPAEEINPAFPDDGSSSTQFVFRVRYQHKDGLPPKPWLRWYNDPWNGYDRTSGVVLYLDAKGTGDYQPHFMARENPKDPEAGSVYIYRVLPHHSFAVRADNDPLKYPWNDMIDTYQSLACGVYHYFFACSDDSLTFDDGSFAFEHQIDPSEWGHMAGSNYTYDLSSTGLDPSLPRSVTGFGEINRPAKRRCDVKAFGYTLPFDSTIYVDRPCLVPGAFNYTSYPISAHEHPKVTCSLGMPPYDDLNVPYDDAKYGYGRFFGTIYPYSRMVNPAFSQSSNSPYDPIYRGHSALAESCGVTSQTEVVFRVLYSQIDNKPPIRIQVLINNASTKSGSGQEYAYTAYSMEPSPNQTKPYNYRTGVWYQCKLKLPRGPHTYYFEAYDGEHVVRFPVRPDRYEYDTDDDPGYWDDAWLPTRSRPNERTIIVNGKSVPNPDYFDNDYFPGPYVNNPPVLSEPSVTPGTGKEGQNFRYRIKYQDPDGHRPLTGYVYIEVDSKGKVERFAMQPETPFMNPAEDHRDDYKNGVYYVFDTRTIKDLALENGIRRYYFEFTDDWGAYHDLNDTIPGETTRFPQGAGNWITGPVISGNRPPTLYQGSVTSQDGTANAATLWTYRVTYRDLDNDAPALIKVYIGLLQPDGKTVLWDAGHTMQQTNPSDKVYSDGAEYYFQTRLGSTETAGSSERKQYFYAFEAYDGIDWATYNSSSNDETRSNAAGCMLLDDLVRVDSVHYKIRPLVVQQCNVTSTTQVTPTNPDDILKVWGVYTTEDVTGTNYYNPGTEPPQYEGGSITLSTPLPSGTTKAWLQYEPQAPIVGPLPIDLPAPAGVIPDAEIYEDYENAPTPILIDDQKNGWINPDDPHDRATLVMRGIAVFEGQPSVKYVTPDSPSDIASVEGVYLNPDLSGENYYDPTELELPMKRTGSVDPTDPSRKTVIPDDPDRIDLVTGVFDINDANMTGTNYYLGFGAGNPANVAWQEALVLGGDIYGSGNYRFGNTVWPTNPYDIVTIRGVYPSMDLSTTNYYRPDGWAAQQCSAAGMAVQLNPAMVGDTKTILGVFVTSDGSGTNYYDSSRPWKPGDYLVNLTQAFAGMTAYIQYVKMDDTVAILPGGQIFVSSVVPSDPNPFVEGQAGLIDGIYKSITYTTDQYGKKPVGSGTNYAVGVSLTNGVIPLTTPLALGSFTTLYVVYKSPSFGFGPYSEYIGLSTGVDRSTTRTMYVAYYPRGPIETTVDRYGKVTKKFITLSSPLPAGVDRVYIRCVAKAFNCGDSVIPLTKDLPAGTSTVYIKYSDIRFTHQFRGEATKPDSSLTYITDYYWDMGTTHYSPDGWTTGVYDPETGEPIGEPNVHIKNNKTDITGGVIGVWSNALRDGTNYFKPHYATRHGDNPLHLRLTTRVPDGTTYLWARCYQKGEYHIDRWNRDVYFLTEKDGSKPIQASYFFGTKMPQALGPNTPPELISGKVNKLRGSRGDLFTYSVIYRDLDGPNGQAPVYVRVYIDGVPYDMTPAVGGTPAYREGALYVYTPPDGLSGGSHKFRFEASDGAAVAWFDANGSHQSSGGQAPATGVVDIDGPWVNNPPELTDGLANPNPTSGGINPWDSVDYTVTYVDADNDEPYFYDPVRDVYDYDSNQNGIMDGPEFSGSPRLWIDSGTVDQYFTGTVAALEEDLMAPGKKRTIVAAGNPGWIPDKFAGALLQITNGAIAGRIYLIQSNTANKLIIATDDLAKDGVIAGGDNASTFRINGLLMAKADPTQQDYTRGVQFKVTVPKLAIGTHKFHFTARSREYKPQWLINQLRPHERVPYSSEARWPSTGDSPGPTVVSTPPSGNTAPVVSLTPESQRDDPKDPVFVGPMAQIALATKPNQVEAFNQTLFAQIREVRGVFLNANEFDLTSVASKDEFTRTKYNPKTANPAFAPGDTKIVLTSSLSEVAAGSELVQFGNVDSSSLLKVTPDASGVIETVLGVYLTSDPTLAGTNYYDETKPFKQGDTVINLKQPLPSGTKRVYVKYKYKPVSAGSPWPAPVYVKYFMQTSSRKFKSSDLVTFRLAYRDADNDAPSYHDSVQGYMKLVFNTTGQGRQMQLLNPPAEGETLDYRTSIPFSTDPMTLPEGQHKYHFEASDGYYVVRYPAGALGDPTANDYMITVNYKPVLTNGKVDPSIGQTATTFNFTVTYKDQDGTANNPPTVTVRITRLDGTPWEEAREMTPATSSPNYAAGVNYVYTRKNLQSGVYKVVFEATDGDGESAVPYPASGQSDITFTVRDTNAPPEIMEVAVVPTAGGVNKLFNYTAKYRDSDGDAPIAKSDGQKDAMTLVIDPGTAKEQRLRMTKAPGEPTNPDYKTGVKYQTAQAISGKKLGSGHHTYTVEASDGTADTALLMSGQVDSTDTSLKTVIPGSPNVIGAVVGVYTDRDLRGKINYFVSADGLTRGQFVGGKIKLPRALPSGTSSVYVHYAVRGPVLLVPYFENFRAVDAAASVPELAPAITQALVGQEVVFVGDMKFPYNTETNPPAEIKNITIQVTKPDGTTVSLSGSIASYEKETETLPDGSKRDISWVGHIKVSYPKGVDSSLVTGTSFTLTASGEWTVAVSWPGDGSWDKASNEGQEVKITVGGQMRTIAVADPSMPDTSTPLVDMITVPKILGSPDIGRVFGYERALDMQIVRWDPTSKTYFRYGTQGLFPNLMPGEAIWIKPKSTYPAESVTRSMLEQGQLALGNPEAPFSELKKYRLAKAFVKDYTKDTTTGLPEPCTIALKTGWNQFGTIFFNWKRDSSGKEITPKVDVGIPLSELKVRYLNQTKSLADAAAAGWVRGYAWRWDAVKRDYVLVHPTTQGAERVLKAWYGYWIRAFVDCDLIIPSTSTYNGEVLSASPKSAPSSIGVSAEEFDAPPPAPE